MEVKKTSYNIVAICGWIGLLLGVIGAIGWLITDTPPKFIGFLIAASLILGGYNVIKAGPWRIIEKFTVDVTDESKKQ